TTPWSAPTAATSFSAKTRALFYSSELRSSNSRRRASAQPTIWQSQVFARRVRRSLHAREVAGQERVRRARVCPKWWTRALLRAWQSHPAARALHLKYPARGTSRGGTTGRLDLQPTRPRARMG